METYCVSCKNTANENSSVRKSKQNRLMLLSNCAVCGKKKSTFIKSKELHNFDNISNDSFKMNTTINKFLLTGDKFMPELHLKQRGFTYSACEPFSKHRERIQTFRETGNLKNLYRNELAKAYFAHDAACSDSKDLGKRIISDKILKDRAYEIARNRGYDGYQRALVSMFYKLFDKKKRSAISVNEQLLKELHKPVIKKFNRKKVYVRFTDNTWAADIAEIESLSSKNKNVKYLLCIIDVFTKYAWVKPLKDKKG